MFVWATAVCCMAFAQPDSIRIDTDSITQLQEVIIISQNSLSDKTAKPLSTLDNYLEKAGQINMIRRGSYAWEPFINGMASERSITTIDGMRVYSACTDKMDPVTSYVEITNLTKANIHSGQSGSAAGATIAGSLDLERKKGEYGKAQWQGLGFMGYETNNKQKIIGGALSHSRTRFFTDLDFTFRDAENYKSGNGQEILYSQFSKYNVSAISGYKIKANQSIEASLIYDHAVDVGYPALTMDVSSAKALIASIEYIKDLVSPAVSRWQTKIYYNDITHVMDDTKRPDVPIRMDMPGWSKTAGFYSFILGKNNLHNWKANVSGHHNRSLAEMTMFSNNPSEKDMFMLTWPGVQTNYVDIYGEDIFKLSGKWTATVNTGLGFHNNRVDNEFGLQSLRIFHADMPQSNTRLLKRFSGAIQYNLGCWISSLGLAYGERAPSISEGYGFYLFNSFDRFDYIGNPLMDNEKSTTLSSSVAYAHSRLFVKFQGSVFYIKNYILARPIDTLSVMTIGAVGVKVYEQLPHAIIYSGIIDLNYQISDRLLWSNKLTYRRGVGITAGNLPLIQPFSYTSTLSYTQNSTGVEVIVNGSSRQKYFNPDFGERPLPAYCIISLAATQKVLLGGRTIILKGIVENLLDQTYTTFADWNRLPRMGRNFSINILYNF